MPKPKYKTKPKTSTATAKHETVPDTLKPYLFHGVDLQWRDDDKEAIATCPWCGKEGKFSVSLVAGLWRCFSCGSGNKKGGGNVYTFLNELWKQSDAATSNYSELRQNRLLLNSDTLALWNVVKSSITGEWLVPGYTPDNKLTQLYRYAASPDDRNGKRRLLPTTTLKHQLFGMNQYDKQKDIVFLCEGPWDGMALWEVLKQAKVDADSGELTTTSNVSASLLATANVLATPGCNVFNEVWCPLFSDKTVNLMFDNDHPRVNPKTGKPILPAGHEGMRRIAGLLSESARPPARINYLRWGKEDGATHDPDLPSGTDVRDFLAVLG